MPPASFTFSQVTNSGRVLQAKNPQITIKDVLAGPIGLDSQNAAWKCRAAYLHVPFCFHKCHYCDFYSIVDNRDRQDAFTSRLIAEVDAARDFLIAPLETIFVGGGTPTLLKPELWIRLLEGLNGLRDEQTEFTVEANPETVTPELLGILVSGGVNRISIGCQSFNPRHLKMLERWHDPRNVHRSVELMRGAGIDNFNLDLIFGIPGQSMDEWMADLEEALSLHPSHLSCYGLTYEPNTALTMKMKAGAIEPIDQDVEASMYEATIDRLANEGFEHYEISNWARRCEGGPSRCRHNMLYWSNANWWAMGPSASGHCNSWRWKNVPRLSEYLESGGFPPAVDVENVDDDARVGEQLMLGLRMLEGVSDCALDRLLKQGSRGPARKAAISRNVDLGLLRCADGYTRLTRAGLLQADTIIAQLI